MGFQPGIVSGYQLGFTEATETSWKAEAKPVIPGKTGSVLIAIDQNCQAFVGPALGADETRQIMFDRLRAGAADAITDLLGLDQSASSQIRSLLQSTGTHSNLFSLLDLQGDGHVGLAEILQFSPSDTLPENDPLAIRFQGFLNFVQAELALGAGNEEVSAIPGVSLDDTAGDPSALFFSPQGLCSLTESFIADKGAAQSLCAKLRAAQSAEDRGNSGAKAGALKAYRNEVAAQAGKSLSVRQAIILSALAQTL